MFHSKTSVDASHSDIGEGVTIAPSAVVRGDRVVIGRNVMIDADVEILADRVEIGDGCRVGPGASIVSPHVALGAGTTIGADLRVELNEQLCVGVLSQIGDRVRLIGQAITTGGRLWMTDDVNVGGGGARTDRALLRIGDRVAIMDRCFLNVCREIVIGDDTALSNGVTLLTHSTWHPTLAGGSPVFAPISIGRDVIVFVNAVIAPGVTVGDHVTVAANALVLNDVPDHSLAVGNPARAVRLVPPYPRALTDRWKDELVRALLADYALELPPKGLTGLAAGTDALTVSGPGVAAAIRYLPYGEATRSAPSATITLACRPTAAAERGSCHFDLTEACMVGAPTPLSEDFRDYLRRRTIRIFTERPFQSLPPVNIARLKARSHPGS